MTPDLVDVREIVPGYESLHADFHNYTISWMPNKVSWYVDGYLIRNYTTLRSEQWQSIRLSDWTGCDANWCGSFDNTSARIHLNFSFMEIRVQDWYQICTDNCTGDSYSQFNNTQH